MRLKGYLLKLMIALYTVFVSSFLFASDCQKAEEYYNRAFEMDSSLENLVKKEQLYKKAVELCPTDPKAHNNLGSVYEEQGRLPEAIKEYKEAARLMPSAPYPCFGLGDVYFKLGKFKDAVKWYEKGLKAVENGKYKPENEEEKEALKIEAERVKGRLSTAMDMAGKSAAIIKADEIKMALTSTRGAGGVASISFSENLIPFDFDKYNIRDDAKPQLDEIGRALKDMFSDGTLDAMEIRGHTDARGSDSYNLELSRKRAQAVKDYLVENWKIPASRLIVKGCGEKRPLCITTNMKGDEACHALNRRVEIVRVADSIGDLDTTSVATRGGSSSPHLVLDVAFLYSKKDGKVMFLSDGAALRSGTDKYFIYVRPHQNCYVYILQKDSSGKVSLLFPKTPEGAYVKGGRDYWFPGFGKGYFLDENRGDETIYLVATAEPINSAVEDISFEKSVYDTAEVLRTRAIRVEPVKRTETAYSSNAVNNSTTTNNSARWKIPEIIERIEGSDGWVRILSFKHI